MPPRSKQPPSSAPSGDERLEAAVHQLTSQVEKLAEHVEVLWTAIDDLRMEVENAIRNLARPAWVSAPAPAPPMPRTEIAPTFPSRGTAEPPTSGELF